MTQTIKASTARQEWSKLLNKVFRQETRIVVEKSGIPVAAIISAQDLQRLDRLEKEREERFRILSQVRKAFKDVADTELEKETAQALAKVRQAMPKQK